MAFDLESLERTWQRACQRLLAARNEAGHWEGELASSPLSTATAVLALALVDEATERTKTAGRHGEVIARGLAWLMATQNPDGGWGDTALSKSNISTTALAWAVLVSLDGESRFRPARSAAEAWLSQAAGSLRPDRLVRAIGDRYGKDRTFSVPILTVLALAGCLGDDRNAWRLVPQLPFELAACPRTWFKWLRLPVVSYALPALIALGRLRHKRRPTINPLARAARNLAERRVLNLLDEIQPSSGGFLEASPLTSFVTMSLAASGCADHPVIGRAVEFLLRSQRPDGSWAIDSNLATWCTTLSINAFATGHALAQQMTEHDRRRVGKWLLDQQYQEEHPFTRADPGGWAWTDLPGGVPDADDTPGALLAIHHLDADDGATRAAAAKGVTWLVDLQNRDGGIPTFCRGWGTLPFDRSSADLTAHAATAIATWLPSLPEALRDRAVRSLSRMFGYLMRTQRSDGSWTPLWFGNQHAADDENPTYGTSRVLRAAGACAPGPQAAAWSRAVDRGCRWLLAAQNDDGGWGGAQGIASTIEETAVALEALAGLWNAPGFATDSTPPGSASAGSSEERCEVLAAALARGARWLAQATDEAASFPPSPIGFYFAKLWYFEELYPLIFTVAALGRLRSALSPADVAGSEPLTKSSHR